jgi:hypothetical protein
MVKFILLVILFLPHLGKKEDHSKAFDLELESTGKWRLAREDAGIKIFTRWVNVDSNLKVRQLKGEMIVDHPCAHVAGFISDDDIAAQWLNRALEHKRLKSTGQNEWITYTLFNLPWPFENQDLVAKNLMYRSGESIIIKIDGVPEYIPEKQGVSRIEKFEGLWRLTQLENNKTKVEYTIVTKSKPLAPRWITDPIINNNFWTTMNNLQKMLE